MNVPKNGVHHTFVFLFLLFQMVLAENGEDADPPEDADEEDRVLAKTDGISIAMCMFGIMTALITITCIFEFGKDMIYDLTEKSSLPIVNALFSEMTVLGFLSMVTFIVASAGFISDLSVMAFGEEREAFLKDLFEQAHYMLFLVMVIFFFFAIFILDSNSRSIELLRSLRSDLFKPTWLEKQIEIASGDVPSFFSAARKEYDNACYFLEYVSMRNEFIFGRQGNYPHKELDRSERLPLDFDYARYLSIMLGHTMAKVIEVGAMTWFQLWLLNVAVYMLLLAFPPVGDTLLVSCISWVVLGYVEAIFIYIFYKKVQHVRWCLCVPEELPHINYTFDSKNMPIAERVEVRGHIAHYHVLQNEIEMVESATGSGVKSSTTLEAERKTGIRNFVHQNSSILTLSNRNSPAWVNIETDLQNRSSFDKYLGGKAPFRQMFLYWWQSNGPELHLTFLRLHMVYLSIQITILAFVFGPLILKHYGHHACWFYILSPLPHIILTVCYIIGPLIRIVTEVGCVGVVADNKVKKDVLRMMKTEKSMKGLMLLSNMRSFISKKKKNGGIKLNNITTPGANINKSNKLINSDLTDIAVKLFKDKFDHMEEGTCIRFDFGIGLSFVDLTDTETDIAFEMADITKMTRIDQRNFIKFFKNFYTDEKWKEGLSPSQLKVGKKLHEAFRNLVDGDHPRLSAEDEYLRLKKEHGANVMQIEEIFHQHDADNSGFLDTEELKVMVGALGQDMTDAQAKTLMDELDTDGNGELSIDEFVVWAFHRHEGRDEKDVTELAEEIFDQVFDTTSDGKIDVTEFIAGLKKIQSDLSYNEKHDLFREADDNASGSIDRKEFVELLLKYS